MAAKAAPVATPVTIVIERDIDAPRALVFEAWTDPKHLVHWYSAGGGWTTPFADVDLRVGGEFRVGFADPDGKHDFVFWGHYDEIEPPSRLVATMGDGRPMSVTLTEIGKNRTHLRLEFGAEGTNSIEQQRHGWTAMVVNLEQYLAAPPAPQKEVLFERVLDAPRAAVFQAWVDPKQLAEWWGPETFTIARATLEPRIGGSLFIEMKGPDGALYPMKGRIVDHVDNERLVFLNWILETAPGVFEMESVTSMVLADAGAGKTKLTLHQRVTKATDKAAFALFGMEEGFRQTVDKLVRFVEKR
ncbi:MAG TPA: SRPBCC domain-containing protein [Bauldia sp.]|nr:SRPBCC domain-containing protein [Bauldia sp.]